MDKIILTKQRHEALRAGKHWDWRIVIGDKAHSWATKKEANNSGDKLILWEQPVHGADYALSKHIVIPKGQYGAGETFLEYAQKGTAKIGPDEYHISLHNGDKFFIKKIPDFGEKAWLLVNVSKGPQVKEAAEKKKPKKKRLHLKQDDLQLLSNIKQYKHKGSFKFDKASVPGLTKSVILSRVQDNINRRTKKETK